MERKFSLTSLLCIFLLINSCEETQKTHSKNRSRLADFEFYISDTDNTGLIQFPDSIGNSPVENIKILNKPKGNYEVFLLNFDEVIKVNYVVYKAPNRDIKNDRLDIRLTASNGKTTNVSAYLSSIRNGECHENNSSVNYNSLLENHRLTVKKGERFDIQLDGFDTNQPASASLLNCNSIQDFGIRTITLVPIDSKPLFGVPNSLEASKFEAGNQGIGYWNRKNDSALFISGKVPFHCQSGKYKFIYSIYAHKLKDGLFLPIFKLFPESNWEWKEQLTAHKYGVISLSIVD